MSGYVRGSDLAAKLERQMSALTVAQRRTMAATKQAKQIMADANKAVNKIITDAITSAADHRTKAQLEATAIIRNARIIAEQEASLIRERAYLEGRTRADQHQIEHDQQAAGTRRREQLEHALRR